MPSSAIAPWSIFEELKAVEFAQPLTIILDDTKFCSFFFQKKFKKEFSESCIRYAADISNDWVNENLFVMDLFGGDRFFIFKNFNITDKELVAHICEREFASNNSRVLLIMDKKNLLPKTINTPYHTYHMTNARPWEFDKVLNSFSRELKVNLQTQASEKLLETPNLSVEDIYLLLIRLANDFGNLPVTHKDLDTYMGAGELNQFDLAHSFAQRNLLHFFQVLIDKKPPFEELRKVFSFVQGHMIKVADPSVHLQKSQPNRYDKQIIAQSQRWENSQVHRAIDYLKRFEFLAKTKNLSVYSQIKNEFLRLSKI